MRVKVRDYVPEDFDAIRALHEATDIDYRMPDLNSPLFLITKVLTVDEVVRAALGAYVQLELYLWLDKTEWASPDIKLQVLKGLDQEVMQAAWLNGIDCAVLYLPPGFERFGERLALPKEQGGFGFTRPRDGWLAFTKGTK